MSCSDGCDLGPPDLTPAGGWGLILGLATVLVVLFVLDYIRHI